MKDFKDWHILEIGIEASEREPLFFKERDIWWIHIGINIGHEEDGKGKKALRPVLILKKFNKYFFLGIPQTTQSKSESHNFSYEKDGRKYTFLLSQVRVYSSKRLHEKLGKLSVDIFKELFKKFIGVVTPYSLQPPRPRQARSGGRSLA